MNQKTKQAVARLTRELPVREINVVRFETGRLPSIKLIVEGFSPYNDKYHCIRITNINSTPYEESFIITKQDDVNPSANHHNEPIKATMKESTLSEAVDTSIQLVEIGEIELLENPSSESDSSPTELYDRQQDNSNSIE